MPPSCITTAPTSVIIGTAGHIDHGKSALVEALTGTDPDRLVEEKRRGITIDLGFAFLEENGVQFGFVDVPGHERFVRNMLAGAAGVDVVLLVIAADESIKPQTREHFDICRLLGISRGVVALTKCDLVDPEVLALVRLEVEDYLRGSFLQYAPIVPVSAKMGIGLGDLKRILLEAACQVPGKDPGRHLRLPIDRSFAMKGFGTVVTGTLISGSIGSGDEVELFPKGRRLRVRGLQSGGKAVERAFAGQRTAVNLVGIEHTAVERGMTIAAVGRFRVTRRIDARLELLPLAPRLKHHARVHFHAGTAETTAEVLLYQRTELAAGQTSFAQFRLQETVLVHSGDRFIVRLFSPAITIGGGTVLDPLAARFSRRDADRDEFLEVLERGHEEAILAAMVDRAPTGLAFADVLARTGWLESRIRTEVARLVEDGRVRAVTHDSQLLVPGRAFENTCVKILSKLERFHKENPLQPGIAREALRIGLGRRLRPETFRCALQELAVQGQLELKGELVQRAGMFVALQLDEVNAKEQLEATFVSAGLAVPSVQDVLASLGVDTGRAEELLQLLLREHKLIRVTQELIFHRDALMGLRERLRGYKETHSEHISVPAFKELTGISRRYAIPLLEYLDRERVTRRTGNERVIL